MFFTDFTLIDRYSVEKIIREGDTYRTKNFRNEIGLCNIIEKEEYVKNKFKEIQYDFACEKYKKDFPKLKEKEEENLKKIEELKEERNNINEAINKLKSQKEELEQDNENLEKEKKNEGIYDKIKKEREKDKKPTDIKTIEKSIGESKDKIEILRKEIEKINGDIKKLKDNNDNIEKEISEIDNNIKNSEDEIVKILGKKNYDKEKIENRFNVLKNEQLKYEYEVGKYKEYLVVYENEKCCPECHQNISNVIEQIEKTRKRLNDSKDNYDKVTANYKTAETLLKNINSKEKKETEKKSKENNKGENLNKINTISIKKIAYETVEIPKLEESIKDDEDFMDLIENNKDIIEHNQKKDSLINANKTIIKNIDEQINKYNEDLGKNKGDTENCEKFLKNLENIFSEIDSSQIEFNIWKKYQESLGKNGISKIVLNRVINNLNKELSYILRDVCDFDIEIELDDNGDSIFYKTKEGENKISITNAASGFEATISGLALRYLLMKYSKTYQPTFLVLDEINATVAPENQEKLMLLYRRMLEDYSYLMVVTHAETNEDDYDHIIKVTKTNGISSISLEK